LKNRKLKERRFSEDIRGIEGLPMKLVIISVVAVAALAIIWVWIGGLGGPQLSRVEADPSSINLNEWDAGDTVTITAYDGDDVEMDDVAISLDGSGVRWGPRNTGDENEGWDDGEVVASIEPTTRGTITITAEHEGNQVTGSISVYEE